MASGKVVIYVGVDACQRELDTRDGSLVAAVKKDLPAIGRGLTRERRFERREIERCELYVELGKPRRIGEPTGGDARLDGLRHLKIQPVEPFQAIYVDTSAVDGLEDLENVLN